MGTVVVGIFPNHDGLVKLTDEIKTGGLSVDRLRIVSPETPADDLATSGATFILSGDAEPESISARGGIITGMGGTGVPGLTGSIPRVDAFHAPSMDELLSELDIPEGRMPDFERAIEQGRTVVGFNAGSEVERIKGLFAAAGAYPVEVF